MIDPRGADTETRCRFTRLLKVFTFSYENSSRQKRNSSRRLQGRRRGPVSHLHHPVLFSEAEHSILLSLLDLFFGVLICK